MDKKTALISVYDKDKLIDFVKPLVQLGWKILASGGTAKAIAKARLPVHDIAPMVGEPILGHRVVTLSRFIHAGLLAKDTIEDQRELQQLGIPWIDLVCVDFYPLAKAINDPEATYDSVQEMTDIGGPCLLRSAAKGRRIIICDQFDRMNVLGWIMAGQPEREEFVRAQAAKAEIMAAHYSLMSARYLSQGYYDGMIGEQWQECVYGENPIQKPAGMYRDFNPYHEDPLALYKFELLKAGALDPSYVNWTDIEKILQTITHIAAGFHWNYNNTPLIAVAAKHGSTCGAAYGEEPEEVINKMAEGNPRAIFGGQVITNFPIYREQARLIKKHCLPPGAKSRVIDGIIAPHISDDAIKVLKRQDNRCRFLINPALAEINSESLDNAIWLRRIRGGFLKQPNFTYVLYTRSQELEIFGDVLGEELEKLLFAWAIGATNPSNTTVLVKDNYLIGNGCGGVDRVGSCEEAISLAKKHGHDTKGAFAYTDSFFPFEDGPETLRQAGVKAVLSYRGSRNDQAVIDHCSQDFPDGNIALCLNSLEHRGFYGH